MEALSLEVQWLVFCICRNVEFNLALARLMTM
jgi:hypothetical protein